MKCAAWIVVLACAGACGKSKQPEPEQKAEPPSPTKPAAPAGTPRPQAKLTVTYDGKPLAMQSALAWKDERGDTKIVVSSVPLACSEVTGNARMLHDGEVTFDVTVAQLLQPDGQISPTVRSTYFDGMTSQKDVAAAGTGDGSPGQPTTIDVDFQTTGAAQPAHQLAVKGTIDALGCAGAAAKEPPAPLPPEQAATIEIAGKKLPVRGARVSAVGDWPQLELTTGGEGCQQVPHQQDSALRVTLTWFKKDKPEVSQVSLAGTAIKNVMDQTYDKKKVVVKPAPAVAGPVEVHADIKVMEYPVKIDGKVTAVACPK
jgi:hypothetical protein